MYDIVPAIIKPATKHTQGGTAASRGFLRYLNCFGDKPLQEPPRFLCGTLHTEGCRRLRFSLVGRLLHTHMLVPMPYSIACLFQIYLQVNSWTLSSLWLPVILGRIK